MRDSDGEVYFEVRMSDAWVWDMYRPARFVKNVRVITFKDVNVEELDKPDLRLPEEGPPFGYAEHGRYPQPADSVHSCRARTRLAPRRPRRGTRRRHDG